MIRFEPALPGTGGGFVITAEPTSGSVDGFNLYLGTIDSLRYGRVYDHAKSMTGASFPDAPDTTKGCNVSGGLALTGRVGSLPAGVDVYLLLVAYGPGGEGPYGADSFGRDRHDPALDPRPATFFCP
jgi:hypothetical protein